MDEELWDCSRTHFLTGVVGCGYFGEIDTQKTARVEFDSSIATVGSECETGGMNGGTGRRSRRSSKTRGRQLVAVRAAV